MNIKKRTAFLCFLTKGESLNELKNSINTLAENAFNVTNLSSAEINSTNQIKISSPIDGKILGTYSSFNAEQDIIFQQSKQWAEKSFNDKAKVLLGVADHIESNPAKFLSLLVKESGKTYQDSVDEIRAAIDDDQDLQLTIETAAQSESKKWELFEIQNARNINMVFPMMEWE